MPAPWADIKDFDNAIPGNNTQVGGVNTAQNAMSPGQVDDAFREVMTIIAKADHGTRPIKGDVLSESTADAGVTADGVLLKDGAVSTDTISESTPDAGVTIDGVALKDGAVDGFTLPVADGSIGQSMKTDGAGTLVFGTPSTYRTAVPTTSGTSIVIANDLADIANATKIALHFKGVSTNTNNQGPVVRIGPSGGVLTSGYDTNVGAMSIAPTRYTDGLGPMRHSNYLATHEVYGTLLLWRDGASGNLWFSEGSATLLGLPGLFVTRGFVTLAGTIADISVTTPDGLATFDNGEIVMEHW